VWPQPAAKLFLAKTPSALEINKIAVVGSARFRYKNAPCFASFQPFSQSYADLCVFGGACFSKTLPFANGWQF
jgi:hypothetical protein